MVGLGENYGAYPMKRDSLFYRLFQNSPSLLFDLLENPPDNASDYRFDSVAVKEPTFEIDGVFLPPDSNGVIYFCEVQFQKKNSTPIPTALSSIAIKSIEFI
jgi:predicted transposase YdaD